MVSNVLRMSAPDLAAALQRIRQDYAEDPEYQELRKEFPDDWPL